MRMQAAMIANRIGMLHFERLKGLRQIAETHKMAERVLQVKRQKEQVYAQVADSLQR
jgi:hypothetical protein